jgi:glycosyltransferase involved in cell wall biosynthesis
MKITIVQGAFLPVPPRRGGAVEKVWEALGREFAQRGHTVTHVSRRCDGLPAEETTDGVQHRRVAGYDTPANGLKLKWCDLLYTRRALRVLPAADIVVSNTFWLPLLLRDRSRGAIYVNVGRFPKGQMRWYRRAARLQAVSSPVAEAIRAQAPGLAARVAMIPYPLPAEAFSGNDATHPRPPLLLYAGRIHPEKGVHLAIAAVQRLRQRPGMESWALRVIGPWQTAHGGAGEAYRRQLEDQASATPGAVTFCEPEYRPAALRAHYEEAAFFLYPSLAERGETFGLAPLEAMAAGCPPIVSALACFRDFVAPGRNGWVFDHRATDPVAALTEALRTACGLAHAERVTAVAAGRQTAEAHSAVRLADVYLEDFRRVVGREAAAAAVHPRD